MQVGIMVTNNGTHSPEKWAASHVRADYTDSRRRGWRTGDMKDVASN